MPYKDHEKQKEFQRNWLKKRRNDHFKGKKCAHCGKPVSSSTADLDHKKMKLNRVGHKIWSRKKTVRDKEISKTQILCKACHKIKTKKDIQKHYGTNEEQTEILYNSMVKVSNIYEKMETIINEIKGKLNG